MRRARGRLHPNDEQLHARRLERHELHVQGELALGRASVTYTWVGGLLMDQQDATGLLYRRNRYYDPMSGRFTQEDPIGLAGGLNVYGFAGGDPVNFADPFGLCPGLPKCGFWGNLLAGVQAGADIADPGEGVNKASWGYKIGFALGDLASTFNDLSLGDPNGYLDPNAAQSIQNDPEVQNTQQRIADNQPKYRQDGQVFENRQNRLPQQARGYYTEWTVDTPGAQNRAKRRIVAGAQGEQYYTDDHYLTFTQIRPASPPPPTKQ